MIHQYFDQALKRHGITGKKLSDVTGISQAHISEFRHGKTNPACDTLMRLLDGADQIEPGAKHYFCQLLAGRPAGNSIENTIEMMDGQQLAQLLFAIAEKLQNQRSPVQELMSA
jgi:transcriptional regulator with XRE-family HTH domain